MRTEFMQVQPDNMQSRLLAESVNPAAVEPQLRKVISRMPDLVDTRTNLEIVLATVGRLDESVTAFSRSPKLCSDPDTHFNLAANVLTQQGSRDEARRHYQQALSLRPDFAATDRAIMQLKSDSPEFDTL